MGSPESYFFRLISTFTERRVLVVGDLMLDEYWYAEIQNDLAYTGIPKALINRKSYGAGGAGNVAMNLRSLGAEVSVVGLIGSDVSGDKLIEILRQNGVKTDGVIVDSELPTTTKSRIIMGESAMLRLDREACVPDSEGRYKEIISSVDEELRDANACVLSDYRKGCLATRVSRHIVDRSIEMGVPLMVGTKDPNYLKYRGVDIVVTNRYEVNSSTPQLLDDAGDMISHSKRLQRELQAPLIVTADEDGLHVFTGDESSRHFKAVARSVMDATGAGDTVLSVLALARVGGATLVDAAWLANVAAGIVVGKPETAQPSPWELMAWLEELRLASR